MEGRGGNGSKTKEAVSREERAPVPPLFRSFSHAEKEDNENAKQNGEEGKSESRGWPREEREKKGKGREAKIGKVRQNEIEIDWKEKRRGRDGE